MLDSYAVNLRLILYIYACNTLSLNRQRRWEKQKRRVGNESMGEEAGFIVITILSREKYEE